MTKNYALDKKEISRDLIKTNSLEVNSTILILQTHSNALFIYIKKKKLSTIFKENDELFDSPYKLQRWQKLQLPVKVWFNHVKCTGNILFLSETKQKNYQLKKNL